MIINPYNVTTDYKLIEDYDMEQIIEDSINYLINNNDNMVKRAEKGAIKNELIKYIVSKNIEIKKFELEYMVNNILNKIYGYGILQKYIDDDSTTDIRIVSYKDIYIKNYGVWKKSNSKFKSNEEFESFIRYSVLKNGGNINYENPIAIVSDKKYHLRIEAGISPVNIENSSMVIRVHKEKEQKTLETLFIRDNMINISQYNFLIDSMKNMKNLLIVGKGGSGKTTLLRALLDKLPSSIAISSNEETAELYLKDKNAIQREVLQRKDDKVSIELERLIKHSLVMSNDVIVIGELKGKEANSFFDAISTGHAGYATLHANSCENSIDRIIVLMKKDIKAQSYTDNFLRRFIISSLDYVIYMKDYKIQEISKLTYDENQNKIDKEVILLCEGKT